MPAREKSSAGSGKPAKLSQEFSEENLKRFIRTQGMNYLRDKNITSIGIGYKVKDGKLTDEMAVQFTVGWKAAPEDLESLGMVEAVSEELGYAANFLSQRVDLPGLAPVNSTDAFKLDGSEVVPYTHFSLALSTSRRLAFWVAWNIDGGQVKKISRKGLKFIFDPRIPAEFQAGDSLYGDNRLDRGHIARRADLLWGSNEAASQANKDSFFFTNITPQMDNFNQSGLGGIWGKLEEAVFAEVDVDDLRVSVFGGPVFHEDDRVFRGVKIPREFFKVLAYVEEEKLQARAFLLAQSLDQLELLDLKEFKVFQVTLTEVEQRCGLVFPSELKAADGFAQFLSKVPKAMAARPPLVSLESIMW
jgi:endonuclease G, mitochondrial